MRRFGDWGMGATTCTRRARRYRICTTSSYFEKIGIDDEHLRRIATGGIRSYGMKSSFVQVGLLPESALNDPAVEAAVAAARAAASAKAEEAKGGS